MGEEGRKTNFFHNGDVSGRWASRLARVTRIGYEIAKLRKKAQR